MGKYTRGQVEQFVNAKVDAEKKAKGDKFTDDQWEEYRGALLEKTLAEKGPSELDLYSYTDPVSGKTDHGYDKRIKNSFGDDENIFKQLREQGFSNVQRDSDGSLIAQDAEGNWHKDDGNFLLDSAGKALPIAGSMIGGVTAGAAAAPSGPGAVAAGMAGAAAGGGVGEAARLGLGKMMGVYGGDAKDAAKEIGTEAAYSAAGEGVGRAVAPAARVVGRAAKAVAPESTEWLAAQLLKAKNASKAAAARVGGFMTGDFSGEQGVADRLRRVLERPTQTKAAGRNGAAAEIGAQIAKDREGYYGRASDQFGAAKENFMAKHGNTPISTAEPLGSISTFQNEAVPNEFGMSGYLPGEEKALADYRNALSMTRVESQVPSSIDNVIAMNPEYTRTPVRATELRPTSAWERMMSGKPFERGEEIALPDAIVKKGYRVTRAEQTPESLTKTYQAMKRDGASAYKAGVGQSSDKMANAAEVAATKINKSFQAVDPEFAAANERYANMKSDLELTKRFENPGSQEAAADQVFGKNKTVAQGALQNVSPEGYERAADRSAWTSLGSKGSPMISSSMAARVALGAGGIVGSQKTDSKLPLIATAIAGGSLPVTQRWLAYTASRGLTWMAKNPQLIPVLLSKAEQQRVERDFQNYLEREESK